MDKEELYSIVIKEGQRHWAPVLVKSPFLKQSENDHFHSFVTTLIENLPFEFDGKRFQELDTKYSMLSYKERIFKLFDDDTIFKEAQKLLPLMEASNNRQEFEELVRKRRINAEEAKPEQTDFDKLMKAILKVPKPPKEKDNKEKDSE